MTYTRYAYTKSYDYEARKLIHKKFYYSEKFLSVKKTSIMQVV